MRHKKQSIAHSNFKLTNIICKPGFDEKKRDRLGSTVVPLLTCFGGVVVSDDTDNSKKSANCYWGLLATGYPPVTSKVKPYLLRIIHLHGEIDGWVNNEYIFHKYHHSRSLGDPRSASGSRPAAPYVSTTLPEIQDHRQGYSNNWDP